MVDLVAHPHHRLTQTFDWLNGAIGQPTRVMYGDRETLKKYLPNLHNAPPQVLVLFQLEHLAWWASCFCPVVIFPMYDHTMHTPDTWAVS